MLAKEQAALNPKASRLGCSQRCRKSLQKRWNLRDCPSFCNQCPDSNTRPNSGAFALVAVALFLGISACRNDNVKARCTTPQMVPELQRILVPNGFRNSATDMTPAKLTCRCCSLKPQIFWQATCCAAETSTSRISHKAFRTHEGIPMILLNRAPAKNQKYVTPRGSAV